MAYASITCLMRTIYQSMELTGCDLQPFYEKIDSLRAIMENSYNIMGDLEALTSLETEIADLANSAEDMVDSESRKVYLAQNVEERSRALWELFFVLEQALECINSIMKQWMATRDTIKDLKAQTYSLASLPEQYAVEQPENIMVGYETEFEMMLDQLVRGDWKLEVVSIVGMGGIGKTTLATKLYSDPCILSHFDIRAKVTVSQEYCAKDVLLGLLSSLSGKNDESHERREDGQLADQLQKHLKVKRYLVVIDDIWTTGAWDDIQLCFPDCNNGSRILLTSRNVEVTEYASSGKPPYHMRLMNFDESWSLLYKRVFVNECFSPEFEKLGKQIALECRGLPLAIVVIAGLLSKIGKALSEWQSVAANVSSVVSTDVDAQCMRVLALSYHYLPHHLKPCFLYFAIFPAHKLIFVDKLMNLWGTEGFLKVEEMKSIEKMAEKYLKDLSDRSLISIYNFSFDGKFKFCGIHDVTRELCLREARNINFVNVPGEKRNQNPCAQSAQSSSKNRRQISFNCAEEFARCCNRKSNLFVITLDRLHCFMPELPFKLIRVLDLASISCPTFPSGILQLIHLRYLALRLYPLSELYRGSEEEISSSITDIPPSISSLCYLQTFILDIPHSVDWEYPFILPSEILMMPQMKDLRLNWNYFWNYEPTEKSLVLNNLRCLWGWNPWNCSGSAFKLFPNLKKLQVHGVPEDFHSHNDLYDFRFLDQLEELEFHLSYSRTTCYLESITPAGSTPPRSQVKMRGSPPAVAVPPLFLPPPDAFPHNLKDLTFSGTFLLPWKDLSVVGKLPKLESLELSFDACPGEEWEVTEEGFPRLKVLQLKHSHIRYWRASCDHFPCLEKLILLYCSNLDSIPQEFADITTLALIDISHCPESVGKSAKQIQHDIQDNYGGSIEVYIYNALRK